MKKLNRILILLSSVVVMAAVLLLSLVGCEKDTKAESVFDIEPLSYEIIQNVLKDVTSDIDKEMIEHNMVYYGTYNGCYVFRCCFSHQTHKELEIAGEKFEYADERIDGIKPRHNTFLVYRKGKTYGLKEAYENGFITKEHIAQLAEYHREYEEYFTGRVIYVGAESVFDIEPLSDGLKTEIRDEWTKIGGWADNFGERAEIVLSSYLGTFNSFNIIYIETANMVDPDSGEYNWGDGYDYRGIIERCLAYKDGHFWLLTDVCECGLITTAEYDKIMKYCNEFYGSEERKALLENN